MNIPKALSHCLDDENKSFGAKALPVYTGKEKCLGAKALQVYTGKPNDYSGSSCTIDNF